MENGVAPFKSSCFPSQGEGNWYEFKQQDFIMAAVGVQGQLHAKDVQIRNVQGAYSQNNVAKQDVRVNGGKTLEQSGEWAEGMWTGQQQYHCLLWDRSSTPTVECISLLLKLVVLKIVLR